MSNELNDSQSLIQPISKIFKIIEQNNDNNEISKIAVETLINKSLENPIYIFPICKSILDTVNNGNIKMIESCINLLETFFDEFSFNFLSKIISNEYIKDQIINVIQDEGNILYFDFNNFKIEKLENIFYTTFDLLNNFNLDAFEGLYSKDSNDNLDSNDNQIQEFSQLELQILFPNKKDRSEFFESENKSSNVDNKINNNLINISNFYEKNKKIFNLNEDDSFIQNTNTSIKKRKTENDVISNTKIIIYINPFYSFITQLIKYISMSYNQRLCSLSILKSIQKFFKKIFYSFYKINLTLVDNKNIEDIDINEIVISDKIKELMDMDLITKLIINSIIDKVVDYNNPDYICLSKDMNISLCTEILKQFKNNELNSRLIFYMDKLINKLSDYKKDWQPLYAVLLFYKYYYDEFINEFNSKNSLISLITKLMSTPYEDILNLLIQILDKILQLNLKNKCISDEEIFDSFLIFNKLLKRYDDIEGGVKYYFDCLFHYIQYILMVLNNEKILKEFFNEIKGIFNNEFILHSFNKITAVRIKYFEILNSILIGSRQNENIILYIPVDFIQINLILAFQGLCLEEDKQLLLIQQSFIINYLILNPYSNVFIMNHENFINLLTTKNLSNMKFFLKPIPNINDLISDLYKSFFVDNLEIDLINQKYFKKLYYLIPIFALVIKNNVNYAISFFKTMKVNIMSVNNKCQITISDNLIISLKTYLLYLELIEGLLEKKSIIPEEVLKYLSDSNKLLDLPYYFSNNKHELINQIDNINNLSSEIFKINTKQITNNILHEKSINDVMKNIYNDIKQNNPKILKIISNQIKIVQETMDQIEKNENLNFKKRLIRGYACACFFLHCQYANKNYDKVSYIINAFINCLKDNNKEAKIFTKYLFRLCSTLENSETIEKILFTFIDNSVKIFLEGKIKGTFKPIKYFFKTLALDNNYSSIQKIVIDYKKNLINNNETIIEKKIIGLLYLFTPIKIKLECIKYETFIEILTKVIQNNDINEINYISEIIKKSDNLIIENDIKKILKFLFDYIDISNKPIEENIFIFQIINSILNDNIICIKSIDFIFITLNYINHPQLQIYATQIFSNQMKVVSLLKMENNYDQIVKGNSLQSLEFIKKIFSQKVLDIKEIPFKLKETLRTYQIIGINWLTFLGKFDLGLALCDDMGLGKTIQTLVAVGILSRLNPKNDSAVSLIICPTTLILNWVEESLKFFDKADLILQPYKNNSDLIQIKKNKKAVKILITSYEKVRDNDMFSNNEYFYLVLDEAHIIKNPKTKLYQQIKNLKSQKRLILTGTPIQNNVMELWSLFNFLMPGFLGEETDFEIQYHKKIHTNIKKLNLDEKLQENIFQTSLSEIRKRIKPFILRRLKIDVLKELPDKIISDYNCEMTANQKQIYDFYSNNNENISELSTIDKLKKICNYPLLIPNLNVKLDPKNYCENSGKFKSLTELLISLGFESNNDKVFENDNKILIFTQYKSMCDIIAKFISKEFNNINYLILDSDIKVSERSGIISKFNKDSNINMLILTTSIGGLGINLSSANIVIMFDHNWNPAVDMQAIDRAHRIGQKKIVQVFRLITMNSIEEKLISLQVFKKYIANNIVDSKKISETGINASSVMESFEEFTMNKVKGKEIKEKPKTNAKDYIAEVEDQFEKEELEIEYLKKIMNK